MLKDSLPRQLAYSVNGARLARELEGISCLGDMRLFYLFTSGVQIDHYDPIVSKMQVYPVLALDNHTPQLTSNSVERLRRKTGREEKLGRGAARAQAQLMGLSVSEPVVPAPVRPELVLCDVSLCIFPVKTRLRDRVSTLVLDTAIQPIRNWLSAVAERKEAQRPLVVVFDELSGKVATKFAEGWSGTGRRYYK